MLYIHRYICTTLLASSQVYCYQHLTAALIVHEHIILTSSISVPVLAALNPTMLNMMILEIIDVTELATQTMQEFTKLL